MSSKNIFQPRKYPPEVTGKRFLLRNGCSNHWSQSKLALLDKNEGWDAYKRKVSWQILRPTLQQVEIEIPKWDRGQRIMFWWPNKNTNFIRIPKMTKYKYEYYSVSQKWSNTNTNIIRFPKNNRIRIQILFVYPEMTEYEYEYYSAPHNYRTKISFCFPKMIGLY